MKKWYLAQISLCILIAASCANKDTAKKDSRVDRLPYYSETTFTPHWLAPDSDSLQDFHKISEFELLNQDGDTITHRRFRNKIYVTDFFFTTCPGICPKMMSNMAILQDSFFDDPNVLLLSHSVTPERDSVPVLKNYAEAKGIFSSKWHLATGAREVIYKLGRNDYFVEENLGLEMEEDDFLHTENFVLIDHNQHIRGIYNGLNKASVQQLIKDIRTLELEL